MQILIDLFSEHFGEILLGIEFLLLNFCGKKKTLEEKQAKILSKKEKKALKAQKLLEKSKLLTEELKNEEV